VAGHHHKLSPRRGEGEVRAALRYRSDAPAERLIILLREREGCAPPEQEQPGECRTEE
jgi:hypothetical protein